MVFPVVMYGCESWTVKKAESQRIDTFELWCWRRLLGVPWPERRSNQSILRDQFWVFIGKNDAKAETPVLFPPHAESWLIGKDSDARRDWGQEEKGTKQGEMAAWYHWFDRHWVWVNSGSWWWTEKPGVWQIMGSQRVAHNWATEWIWTGLRSVPISR